MFIEADRTPNPRAKAVASIGYPDGWLVLLHQAMPFAAAPLDASLPRARPGPGRPGMANAVMTTAILGQLLIDSHAGRRHHLGDALAVEAIRFGHSGFVLTTRTATLPAGASVRHLPKAPGQA